ncbi:hypothetical protein DSO57_1017555 [Entomophthora muscae]|uniref:Uncharacterized protein n=1 Tax=Entomophthora muscae TaxID=34485 RepID=A0ACC2STL6_9FUNG|nr:hypothetical protein DSO57_1017555 [Entomophthora muscae]
MYTINDLLNPTPKFSFHSYNKTNPFKKRFRRKSHEIQRHYKCTFQGCQKSYGTLNHLNNHIFLQSHGPKHTPDMYHELRSNLRKQKTNPRPLKLCLHHLLHPNE